MVKKTNHHRNFEMNSSAVVSLTLGILSVLLPLLGFILGAVGVVFYIKAKKDIVLSGQSGSGLAVAGLVCSIVGILIQVFMVLAYLLFVPY